MKNRNFGTCWPISYYNSVTNQQEVYVCVCVCAFCISFGRIGKIGSGNTEMDLYIFCLIQMSGAKLGSMPEVVQWNVEHIVGIGSAQEPAVTEDCEAAE